MNRDVGASFGHEFSHPTSTVIPASTVMEDEWIQSLYEEASQGGGGEKILEIRQCEIRCE